MVLDGVAVRVTDSPPELPWALAVGAVVVVVGVVVVVVVSLRVVVVEAAVMAVVEAVVEVGPAGGGAEGCVPEEMEDDRIGPVVAGAPAGASWGPADGDGEVALVVVDSADSLAPPPPQAAVAVTRTAPTRLSRHRRAMAPVWQLRRPGARRPGAPPVAEPAGRGLLPDRRRRMVCGPP